MLGHKLLQEWQEKFDVRATVRDDFSNIEKCGLFEPGRIFERVEANDTAKLEKILKDFMPEVVVNAAGIIKQVPSSGNVIETLSVNSIFPHRLAELTAAIGARMITFGTDCVFDGKKGDYTESDIPNARDLYGMSKILGEVAEGDNLTIRTSIIGRELFSSHSLLEWFLSQQGKTIKGFKQAIFSGFPTIVLAEIVGRIIEDHRNLRGLYHVSSEPISKYDLLNLIKARTGLRVEIEPDTEFRMDRSLNSDKFKAATGFAALSWDTMIEQMMNDAARYDQWRKPGGVEAPNTL